jgi:hypothetical protein
MLSFLSDPTSIFLERRYPWVPLLLLWWWTELEEAASTAGVIHDDTVGWGEAQSSQASTTCKQVVISSRAFDQLQNTGINE